MEELQELERVLSMLIGEMNYHHAIFAEACFHVAKRTKNPFYEWLMKLADLMQEQKEDFYIQWEKSMIVLREKSLLRKEDIQELLMFGQTIGYLDVQTQETSFQFEKEIINQKLLEETKKISEKEKLYVTFGALAGILLTICLI